ncbi:nuclear transport factor 2 family protein [Aromatoleum toluclasticum]|uniref:nuclear transport factor 2 family protein n=1 Tax=Aromatoleum toluclasticum TaxID=92003 RepID=UPI00035DCF16|nr:nuclear transport factor 2 family protein [Aromatoleum toluclasticum]
MAVTEAEIEIGKRLFLEGWCGSTPDSFVPFVTEDFVMRDTLSHSGELAGHAEPMRGHKQVMDFWGWAAGKLRVVPEEVYVNGDNGMALSWMMYLQITDDSKGPENRGRWHCGEGMSRLEFRDGKVCLEIDYWSGPQGICDDWEAHFARRRKMTRPERGAITGA